MKGICALYDIETDLQDSHIFPKFIIKYTKKTGSKYLRKLVNPNVRIQDGIKKHLLGKDAEQEFSKREKWFAENIFVPYLATKKSLPYNENLYYFVISFLWRALVLELKITKNINDKWYYNILIEAEKEWKCFLVNNKTPENFNQICIWFTDRVVSNTTGLKGIDFYLTRVLDATIVDNESQTCLLVYGKFNKFIFWAVLKNYGDENKLDDVKISPNGGIFNIPQTLDYFPIISFLQNRIKQVSEMGAVSLGQQKIIEAEISKDPEAFWKSDVGQSLFNDKYNLD
ncbi:hypothetical protein [Chryseobacterium lineare]